MVRHCSNFSSDPEQRHSSAHLFIHYFKVSLSQRNEKCTDTQSRNTKSPQLLPTLNVTLYEMLRPKLLLRQNYDGAIWKSNQTQVSELH